MVPSSGDLDAASVIEGFLRQHPRGELRLGTGYGSAYGLAWLHHRTRRRPVRLLIGDLRTGFDRSSDDDRKAALAFLSRDDVSVRGCHAPDGMLHSKVWIALDAAGSERPSGVLVGSANLTRAGLHKNDETVARAVPEEHKRIHDELVRSMRRSWDAKDELMVRLGREATDIDARPARSWSPEQTMNFRAGSRTHCFGCTRAPRSPPADADGCRQNTQAWDPGPTTSSALPNTRGGAIPSSSALMCRPPPSSSNATSGHGPTPNRTRTARGPMHCRAAKTNGERRAPTEPKRGSSGPSVDPSWSAVCRPEGDVNAGGRIMHRRQRKA